MTHQLITRTIDASVAPLIINKRLIMKPYQVIRLLRESPGRLDKERVIRDAWEIGCYEFFLGAQLAYDKLITFGVKKVPLRNGGDDVNELGYTEFYELSDRLRRRELTGNNAIEHIGKAAISSSDDDWNDWYRLVLMKDFKCGATATTINKILKEYGDSASEFIIPVFACQLAQDSKNHPNKMVGKKMLDIKLDGVRILAVCNVDKNTVTLHTRNGKVNTNFPHIEKQLLNIIPYLEESMVLDGEMVSRTFQDLMTQFNRKGDADTSDSCYALFDMVPLKDFLKGKYNVSQRERDAELNRFITMVESELDESIYNVPKVTMDVVEDKEEFEAFNRAAIEAGYEGIMIKDPDAEYLCKKRTLWMKLKPTITVDLTIVGMEHGEEGKEFENTLGALVCEGEDDGKLIRVNVGGGLSHEQRDEFWKNKDNIIGFVAEIKADAITQNKDGSYSLRFPRFVRFRGDEPGEKY